MWSRANLWTVINRPEYHFQVEELRNEDGAQMIMIHLDVNEWSKTVLKQLIAEFKAFRECTDAPLFCTSPASDTKWQKFISLFGWRYLLDMADGQKLYVSYKDTSNGVRNPERDREDHE